MKIVIVDYEMGNLFSVYKKISLLDVKVDISSDINKIRNADKIILPGVGNFAKAMQNINKLNLHNILNEIVLIKKKPVLGICLGMQLMAKFSEEGESNGLGWFEANVIKFKHNNKTYKNPHMGWNNLILKKDSIILKDLPENHEFYFVHSYHIKTNHLTDISAETIYEYSFCSAIEKENIFGVQFHPEKSHQFGEILFKNFLKY